MQSHIRAKVKLITQNDAIDFIKALCDGKSDFYDLENFDGSQRVNARSILGVLYATGEFPNEIYLVNERKSGQDYYRLSELFEIFDKIEINLYKESESARKDIVAEHMYDYIDDILSNDSDVSEITLPEVIKHLNSKLGISLIDLNNLFKDVTQRLSARYDIIRLPFKIQRNMKK